MSCVPKRALRLAFLLAAGRHGTWAARRRRLESVLPEYSTAEM